jgi:hypothetical protein
MTARKRIVMVRQVDELTAVHYMEHPLEYLTAHEVHAREDVRGWAHWVPEPLECSGWGAKP